MPLPPMAYATASNILIQMVFKIKLLKYVIYILIIRELIISR